MKLFYIHNKLWRLSCLIILLVPKSLFVLALNDDTENLDDGDYGLLPDSMSDFSRNMMAFMTQMSNPSSPKIKRRVFPESNPHVCLAFLSCCQRTDLLNHTLAGVLRHMEEDEPDHLRYEIAWVDNGSGEDYTQDILDSYQIEKALPLDSNHMLALGMNLLIRNLCTAPYILLLEEDWLYLDDLVAKQTHRRKTAITTAIAFLEGNQTAYDGRPVMGVFLRPETYSSFLTFPFMDLWEERTVDLMNDLPKTFFQTDESSDCDAGVDQNIERKEEEIHYQIICSDPSTTSKYIWGSYTNGAGLYRRSALTDLGRMYGEGFDAFHDRYVEGNYAYRAGLKFCHAAIQLGSCQDLGNKECAAAFHHIGGGRGTRPMKIANSKCSTQLWNFVGTPMFRRYKKILSEELCSRDEILELKHLKAKELDAVDYRKEVKELNKEVFEKERAKRDEMIQQARIIRATDKNLLRKQVEWLAGQTDEQITALADKMERLAQSPHPLQGFWDGHGRPIS